MTEWGGAVVKNPPTNAGDVEMQVQSLGWEDHLEEGNTLHYSCLENPMDREAWRATVHGMAKRWTQLSTNAQRACLGPCPYQLSGLLEYLDCQWKRVMDSWIQPPFSHKPYLFFIHLFSTNSYKERGKLLTWQHPTMK